MPDIQRQLVVVQKESPQYCCAELDMLMLRLPKYLKKLIQELQYNLVGLPALLWRDYGDVFVSISCFGLIRHRLVIWPLLGFHL